MTVEEYMLVQTLFYVSLVYIRAKSHIVQYCPYQYCGY